MARLLGRNDGCSDHERSCLSMNMECAGDMEGQSSKRWAADYTSLPTGIVVLTTDSITQIIALFVLPPV